MTTDIQPHQQRMLDEVQELNGRIAKLGAFMCTPVFANLAIDERLDMLSQLGAMADYSAALARRIARFLA